MRHFANASSVKGVLPFGVIFNGVSPKGVLPYRREGKRGREKSTI
jgi:hypothetical protein